MNYILFDDQRRSSFLPLTFTNTCADLLMGAFTNRQRWEKFLGSETSSITVELLKRKFPLISGEDNILINTRLIPEKNVVNEIVNLGKGKKLISDQTVLAMRMSGEELVQIINKADSKESLSITQAISKTDLSAIQTLYKVNLLENIWDFYLKNSEVLINDVRLIDDSEFKSKSGEANTYLGKGQLLIHKEATVNASVLNTDNGPIIIDEGAEVMEGCMIRGPFYLGKNAVLKMGAKVYGASSIGDYAKVGGEVNNSVINAYSNKAHDGFIGNSVIGYWCNMGADSNTSNLKNDYSIVKLWNYDKESFVKSGQQFLGLIMGDHSKCGINTMFNTGTVTGVCCNIYGSGFQPNFIPSFSWGKPGSFATYQFEKALEVIKKVMERRNLHLDGTEELLLREVFETTESLRNKFNKTT